MRRLLCLFGMHERDKSRIRHNGEDYVAPCRGCGRMMVKGRHGERRWQPAGEARQAPRKRARS